MAHEITVPRLGWSMEQGTFVGWLKRDGDVVRPGERLFELEGEKATQEIEAVDGGVLRIPSDAPSPGTVVPVGAVLAYLVAEGEAVPSAAQPLASVAPAAATPSEAKANEAPASAASPSNSAGRISSPRARRVAAELGVDWQTLTGSGRGGRIRERDVREAAAGPRPSAPLRVAPAAGRSVPSARRQTIARRLRTSQERTVPVTLTSRADATNIVNLREQFKAAGRSVVPSYGDIIARLTVEALRRHPLLASCWQGEELVSPEAFHIGIAVDSDEGLLVPVVRSAERLPLAEFAARSRELIERARAGDLTVAEMQGGVFTVTNLGAYGIDAFTPVLNYPQSAILGLGVIRSVPAVHEGQCVPRSQITLSLTFDHAALDGAPAARFLQAVCEMIENPSPWLL